jgi:hypothetical protein
MFKCHKYRIYEPQTEIWDTPFWLSQIYGTPRGQIVGQKFEIAATIIKVIQPLLAKVGVFCRQKPFVSVRGSISEP